MGIIAPDVAPQPIPGVRVTSNADATTFGGGPGLEASGQEIQKMALEAGDIATFEKIRADQTAVEGAQVKGSKLLLDSLYDPKTGVLTAKGTNALQAQQEWEPSIQRQFNDLSQGLSGESQKGAFNKWAVAQFDAHRQTVLSHVDTEMRTQAVESHKALLENQAGLAALAHGNPDVLAQAFQTVNSNAKSVAMGLRLDPKQTEQLIQDDNDKLHTSVIDGMMKFQADDSAQKYFDANKDNISPKAQEKIADALVEHNLRIQSATAAQTIMTKNPDSESDALADADKIKNPLVQDAARKLISARFSEDRAARKNDQDSLFLKMNEMVNKKGLTDPIDRKMAIPAMAWQKLSAEQQRAIEKGGMPDVTSPKKWLDFMDHVKDGDVVSISRADLESKYLPYFDMSDAKRAEDMWAKGHSGGTRLMDDQTVVKSVQTAMVNAGIIRTDFAKHTSDQKLLYQFDGDVHEDILGFEKSQKRSPKPEEIQQIIDNRTKQYFKEHTVKTGIFTQKPVALLTDKEKGDAYVPYGKIPQKDIGTLEDLMRAANRPITNNKTGRAYAAYLMGDKKRLRSIINE